MRARAQVNGGYDFPGSNSGIDMFALTGWIPEQFRTDEPHFEPTRLWQRMQSASRYGDCLLTVATGELAEQQGREEETIGLVRTHAYAVLQVREVLGVRLLQLKNPWSRVRWKGAYSVQDAQRWTPALREALHYDQMGAAQSDNGVFWIDYPSLLRFFQGVYLNWNPALFAHNTSHHGQWPQRQLSAVAAEDDTVSLGKNPQYALTVHVAGGSPAAVWLLLTRHTTRKDQGRDDYLTMHVFKGGRGGFRCYYLEEAWRQGVYSNRPHCLVQFDLPPGAHRLTLALAQYRAVAHQVDYTLKVYSMASFTLRKLPYAMRHVEQLQGGWRGASAGGCVNFDTTVDNPRFRLAVDGGGAAADVQLELTAPAHLAVGLELHALQPAPHSPQAGSGSPAGASSVDGPPPPPGGPSGGGGLVPSAKPVAASGAFRKGFCLLEARQLPPGQYVLTACAFEPRQEGGFALGVGSSSAAVSVRAMAPEGSKLFRQALRGEWSAAGGTAVGCANHGAFHRNPQYRLTVAQRTELLLRLRLPPLPEGSSGAAGRGRASLGLDVFRRAEPLGAEDSRGARTRPVLSAGGGIYSYPPGGALIARTAVEAGSYLVVPSTFAPYAGAFELIVYAGGAAAEAKIERLH